MNKVGAAAKVVGASAKLAVKYGPQVKIVWDNGGRKATEAGMRRARSLTARRKADAHAATVLDGSFLRIAPGGTTAYVVLSGDQPIAVYPPHEEPLETLLDHVDLGRRELPSGSRPGVPSKGLRRRR